MTTKFWKSWQKRLKDTKYIILYNCTFADDWEKNDYISNTILKASDIINYNFKKDKVKISILDYNMEGYRVPAIMTLKRVDIKTIEFIKQ